MVKKTAIFLILLSSISIGHASLEQLHQRWNDYRKRKDYPAIIKIMVENNLYFAAIPFVKEYMFAHSSTQDKSIDDVIDKIITNVGTRQFEALPIRILRKWNIPTIQYILAKKYFRAGKNDEAVRALIGRRRISRGHPASPYALHLEGTLYSMMGKSLWAINAFRHCVEESNRQVKKYKQKERKRQLTINRDSCLAGISRTQFRQKKYKEANLSYLDIKKSSHIWPEILFEEAWNSFYLKDYNRALGKLATYKSPVLSYIFNPEIEILRALTYLELCLYADAKRTVNEYYRKYEKAGREVAQLLKKYKKDYRRYYFLSKSNKRNRRSGHLLLDKLLRATVRDPTFRDMYRVFRRGRIELQITKGIRDARIKRVLRQNLKSSLVFQRDLIGAYVRQRLLMFMGQMNKAFEGMSYIGLEVSKIKKYDLYGVAYQGPRSRGDIKHLQRTPKQYFWNFNGEFWADELGDYVFSLKPECK